MRSPLVTRALFFLVIATLASACGDETPAPPSSQSGTLAQFALAPTTVDAGLSSQGTVILNGRAPANGTEIRLSSSDGVAVVPASILVPSGAVSATFTVTTRLVAADTSATVSAMLGADKRDAVLRVMGPIPRPPTLQALVVEPAVLKGGQNTQGSIQLSGPALAVMTVTLRSSNPLAVPPATITVPMGAASATFTVVTRPVALDTIFDIVATLTDQTRAAQIRLTP